jgi:acetyl-CoA carboxylase biotin carboxyl carrier protein
MPLLCREGFTVPHQHTPTSQELLEAVCRSAAQLMTASSGPVRRMKLQAGDVAVELEWPESVPTVAVLPPTPSMMDELDPDLNYVCSPIIGTFYRAPEPGAEPFVREGDEVEKGQQIAIVEAMKMMVPVEADYAGTVAEILVSDGTSVEYGERLIAVRPVGSV